MASECGVSFNICRMRITELDTVGNVKNVTPNSYVTDGVQSIAITVNKETGNNFSVRNGCGCSISKVKLPDTFNWFEFTFTDSQDEPQLEAMLLGQPTISAGGIVVGINADFSLDCDEQNPAVALEFWTQNYSGSAISGTYPYFHWVFPWVEWTLGDSTFQEGPAPRVYTGQSKGNQLWGSGPYGDGPPDGSDVGDFARWLTAESLPAAGCSGVHVAPGS